MKTMQQKAYVELQTILTQHEERKLSLEAHRHELKNREKELQLREALNESEKRNLDLQKEMVIDYIFKIKFLHMLIYLYIISLSSMHGSVNIKSYIPTPTFIFFFILL